MNDEYYMKIALNEAHKSLKNDDVPVGTVIVKNGVILAKAYNTREKKQLEKSRLS